jgi:SAM-dependent methyltransferase
MWPALRGTGGSPGEERHALSGSADPGQQWAESFGSEAQRYDRARPRYPQAMVERILAASPGLDVLDVGCGTGIAARQFRSAGARVIGLDVDARMAELARAGGFAVEVAPFEAWDAAGRSFDAIISAQAWHWIDAVAGAQKAAALLRPGGRLSVFWNVGQPPADLADAFSAVYRRVMAGSPVAKLWSKPALEGNAVVSTQACDGIRGASGFGDPEQWRFEWEWEYGREDWLDQLLTYGPYSRLGAAQLDALLGGIGAAVDAAGGGFDMHYTTVVVTAAQTRRA